MAYWSVNTWFYFAAWCLIFHKNDGCWIFYQNCFVALCIRGSRFLSAWKIAYPLSWSLQVSHQYPFCPSDNTASMVTGSVLPNRQKRRISWYHCYGKSLGKRWRVRSAASLNPMRLSWVCNQFSHPIQKESSISSLASSFIFPVNWTACLVKLCNQIAFRVKITQYTLKHRDRLPVQQDFSQRFSMVALALTSISGVCGQLY